MRVNKRRKFSCEEQQWKMLQQGKGQRNKGEEKRRKQVPAVTNERIVKLDYDYHTH